MKTKQDILNTAFSLEEMAISDLKGVNIHDDSAEKVAAAYIKNARTRDMNDKQIASGIGSTFRNIKGAATEKVTAIKAEIRKQLGSAEASKDKPVKVTVTKKAKEDKTYQGTEKVKAAAKKASEVMKEDIMKNIDEKSCPDGKKKKDVYMSKDSDKEHKCKYCGEECDTEEVLDKHQKTCK